VKEREWHSASVGMDGTGVDGMCGVREYLNSHRINVNIRQVEDENHTFASSQQQQTSGSGDGSKCGGMLSVCQSSG